MSYAFAKTDKNQAQIMKDLRKAGLDVDDVSSLKKLYDIVVSGMASWSNGRVIAVRVEIKRDKKAKLTPDEVIYWSTQKWAGNLIRAESAEDVLAWFGLHTPAPGTGTQNPPSLWS